METTRGSYMLLRELSTEYCRGAPRFRASWRNRYGILYKLSKEQFILIKKRDNDFCIFFLSFKDFASR